MPKDCSCSDARATLGELCIMIGTHYDLAPRAVDALETLATENKSILEEATTNWRTIVDVSSDVSESKTITSPELETPNDRRRVGAMRALATLSREHPSTAPIETFVLGIREPHPLIRLYASYGLAAVASRKPELTHPHVDTIVEEIGGDLNSLGADVWPNPNFSTSVEVIDELVHAKLIRMAFNSTLRIDDSDGFQQVAADVNERLDGDLVLTADKLVRTLPFDPDIWPIYIDLLNDVGDPEPDLYVEQAVCYGLAYTCEDWRHDGQLADSVDNESTTDMLALLRRGMETVDDPDLTAPLNRAIGDFVMAWVNGTILPGVPWSAVQEEATHRRLTGADKLFDGEQSVEAQLEETAESLTGVIKQHTADLDYLHDYSVLYPLENIASITPRVVRPHINLIQNILSELPVDGNKNGMYVLARCSRIVGYVGEVFPEITERTAPMVIEFLRDVVKEEQDDLLGDALAGAVISAKRRPELLEPFGGQLSNWCTDPPGADEMRMEVPTDKIQYYAIYGLYMISDEATDKILTEVTTDSDTPQRVRELAKYILHDG